MHWVLVANGNMPAINIVRRLETVDRWIGVDGGCRILDAWHILPDLVIGDMDSVPTALLNQYKKEHIPTLMYPSVKDETDLELALNLALDSSPSRITILGALGDRLDHTLANVLLLSRCLEHGVPAKIMDDQQSIYLVDSYLELTGKPGDLFSLMPVKATITGVTLSGLQYPLKNATLAFSSPQGLSNIFTSSQVVVQIQKGMALVFHQYAG